jgi:23S rRNA (adenine2030-N6)-methyltransferase
MNYRHAFHAGNFADVMKHVCLVALLRGLARKDSPWFYLDTHAGAGDYDLTATPAQRTGEYRQGIARLLNAPGPLPSALADYLDVIRPLLGDGNAPRRYPGSPLIAAALARPQDRLVACELNPLEFESLQTACGGVIDTRQTDGYQALKALLPPRERRGLTLIDPPYERPDEFTRLAGELVAAHRRFATGVFALWYPLKDEAPVAGLKRALEAAGLRRLLEVELRLTPLPQGGVLHGCGVLVLNPPWGFAEQMQAALPALAAILAPGRGEARTRWRVPE